MSLLNKNPKDARTPKRAKSVVKDLAGFSKVGGLDHHLKTLREMVILPLLQGNVFSHFKIKAPRGVLFHGPPGESSKIFHF